MKILMGLVLAIIVTIACYISILYYDKEDILHIEKKEKLITEKKIIAILIGLFTTVVVVYMKTNGYAAWIELLFAGVFLWGMAFLAVTDLKIRKVPNKFLGILLLLWILFEAFYILTDINKGIAFLLSGVFSGVIAGIIFFATYLISKKRLGAGDIKLSVIMGLYLRDDMILGAILYGTVICCLYSLIQVARKKISMKDSVPMVPFLYLGCIIVYMIV